MYTRNKIKEIISEELTPIGYHEEHGKYIDGVDKFVDRLIKLFALPIVVGSDCPECGSANTQQKTKSNNECKDCKSEWAI